MRKSYQRRYGPLLQCVLLLAIAIGLVALISKSPEKSTSVSNNTSIAMYRSQKKEKVQDSVSKDVTFQLKTYKPEKVESGVHLIPVNRTEKVYLVDMHGKILHYWNFDALRARMLPNCNLLVLHGTKWAEDREPWKSLREVVREYNWAGEVVWEYNAHNIVHHDVSRLSNGNTLIMKRTTVVSTESVAGSRPENPWNIRSDAVLEVSPEGEIVWQWQAHHHLDLTSCGWRKCKNKLEERLVREKVIDWTHTNTLTTIPKNQWFRAGDKRFTPGNIMILPRNFWTIFIADRETGKIVWKYEGDHENGTKQKQGLVRGHEAHMIPEGFPGAGNILVFDNGLDSVRKFSIVREINPVTKETVWQYSKRGEFFGYAGGSIQRLKNGNTLISQDRGDARIFEVTPEKEIVWELNPNRFFPSRANRYDYNYCPKLAQFQNNSGQS